MAGKKWDIRRLHRWFAVLVGIAFSAWVVSGILMILGFVPTANGITMDQPRPATDLTGAVISPSEAVAAVSAGPGTDGAVTVRNIRFRAVGTRRVYDLEVEGAGSVLIDIKTGEIVQVDMELARELARGWMQPDREIVEERIVESYDLWYAGSVLPVFRFVFDNGTRAHVEAATGDVTLADWEVQAFYGILGLHDFSVLASVFRIGIAHWLLWAASLGSIVVIVTGYFLAYPTLPFIARRRNKVSG